jgi:Protein of unknown function (DUF2384)
MVADQHPRTIYEPPAFPDLRSKKTRERLSRSAVRGFLNIVERWGIAQDAARDLLGGVSVGTYYGLRKSPHVLDADALTRVSYLIGIFKALNILYSEPLADAWMTRPNTNRIFGGDPPIEYARRGGLPALQIIRRLLDARRGG